MQGFAFNTRRKVFSDPLVREALAYGFDFQWANKNLFFDQYTRTDSYFENSDLASSGLPTGRELEILEPYRDQLPDDVFTAEYQPPTTEGQQGLRENLRTALGLLKSAGYVIRDGKMVHGETGEPLAFEILLFQKSFERVVLPFKNNLGRLGIAVTVRLGDSNQYIQRLREFDFDMITQVFGQSDSPGNEQREYWHSSTVDAKGSRNYMGVSDPVAKAIVESGLGEYGVMALLILLLITVGMFLDGISIFLIFVPLLLPIMQHYHWDPVWFGVILTLKVALGQFTPPLAVNLMVSCRIAGVRMESTVRWVGPMLLAMFLVMIAVIAFPQLALWLPARLGY